MPPPAPFLMTIRAHFPLLLVSLAIIRHSAIHATAGGIRSGRGRRRPRPVRRTSLLDPLRFARFVRNSEETATARDRRGSAPNDLLAAHVHRAHRRLDDAVPRTWEEAADFEWERARDAEEKWDRKRDVDVRRGLEYVEEEDGTVVVLQDEEVGIHFPFMFCMERPRWDGYRRRNFLLQKLAAVRGLDGTNRRRDGTVTNLVNAEDITCVMKQTRASFAKRLANGEDDITVHPITSLMKMRRGTIDYVLQQGAGDDVRVKVRGCPHVVMRTKCSPRRVAREGDEDDCQFHHVGPKLRRLLRTMKDGTKTRRKLHSSFYWGNIRKLNTTDHEEVSDGHTFWKAVLDRGIDAPAGCVEIFSRMNITSVSPGEAVLSLTFPSMPQVWGDTIASHEDADVACLLSIVAAMAALPDVCSISPQFDATTRTNVQQVLTQGSNGVSVPFYDMGITGMGQIVAVSDSGLDFNHCYFWDADGKDVYNNIARTNRKVIQYITYANGIDEPGGHGTTIASIIAGRRAHDGTTESIGQADGIAPNAKLTFFDLGESDGKLKIPSRVATFLDPGREAGARVHNLAWGSDPYQDEHSNEYQAFDADLDAYLNQHDDFVVVVAAGNEGMFCPCGLGKCKEPDKNSWCSYVINQEKSVASPAIAKNIISVGASQTQYGYKSYVNNYSARGPTDDGRISPILLAPGQNIVSADARSDGVTTCDTLNSSAGLTTNTGTSMAAAVVSGSVALVREYFEQGFYPSGSANAFHRLYPSNALVKAVLLNGAQDMLGVDNSEINMGFSFSQPFDAAQGFGRISLLHSLPLQGKNSFNIAVYDRQTIHSQDQHRRYPIELDSACMGNNPTLITVTLVWTDPPSAEWCSSCLLNDLDLLVVEASGRRTHFPNGRTSKDGQNNAERVKFTTFSGNNLVIHVVPANLISESQEYALVVTGCIQPGVVMPDSNSASAGGASVAPFFPQEDTDVMTLRNNASMPKWTNGLTTTYQSSHITDGVMFDVVPNYDLYIFGFDIHLNEGTEEYVEVWTKDGSYFGYENNKLAWTQLGSFAVHSKGIGRVTFMPDFAPVPLYRARTQSFYITTSTMNMLTTLQPYHDEGSPFASNRDLSVLVGISNQYRFGNISVGSYGWNGAIRYHIP